MLCDNCGSREAHVRYSENINGVKKEMNLCEECSKKLGIEEMNFNIPIDFSSFFGEFLEDFSAKPFMPLLNEFKDNKCEICGSTFEDIINTGKFGCNNCYEVFQDRLDPIIKKIQGSNRHVGRLEKISNNNHKLKYSQKRENKSENKEENKLEKLKEDLKKAIKEERYEDAAKLRDEIRKQEK